MKLTTSALVRFVLGPLLALTVGHAAQAAITEKALYELGTPKAPLTLSGDKSSYVFKIPVSPRESIRAAQLVLHTVNSTALLKARSSMTVRLNANILGQYPLDPAVSRQRNVINLPAALLRPGFNDLQVSVVQHYTYDCEDPGSSELWTEIDPVNSKISMLVDGIRANPRPRLSQLGVAFDARTWNPMPVKVVTATESFSPEQVAALSHVTQGVYLRRGRHFSEFSIEGANASAAYTPQSGPFTGLNPELTSNADVILVGTKSELSRLVSGEVAAAITGPYAGIFPSADGAHFMLVLSGRDDQELQTATRAFASPEFIFSDTDQVVFTGNVLPAFPLTTTDFDVQKPFNAFNFGTNSVRGYNAPGIAFRFRTPGDFTGAKGRFVTLRLHFSYGAGLRDGSALNVKINGQFVSAIPMNNPAGAEFTKYEVAIPTTSVRPGFNTVDFEPVFAAGKGRCEAARDDNMVMTIFDNSTIEVPKVGGTITVPDLQRFSNSMWPHGSKAQIALLDSTSGFITHAMQVMGMLALKNEGPIDATFSYAVPTLGHAMVIGNYKDFDEKLRGALPLPSRYDWKSKGTASAWMQAQVDQRIVTALVTPDYKAGMTATAMLVNRGFWNGMAGEAVVLDPEHERFDVMPARTSQEISPKALVGTQFTDWRTIALATVALALVLGLAVMRLAGQRAQERLMKAEA